MLIDDVYVAGLGEWLAAPSSVADAVARGEYDADEAVQTGYESVCVASDEAPPDMAIRAGRAALSASGLAASDIAALLHANLWFQGVDYWPTASYVHNGVLGGGGRHAPAFDVSQMSNGGLAAVELATGYLLADPSRAAVLVTTGDRLAPPAFDRWRGDLPGIVYGDGAAAVVLSRRGPGVARLRALHTVVDTRLEGTYRGDVPFSVAPGDAGPVDVRSRRAEFMTRHGRDTVRGWVTGGLTQTVDEALALCRLRRGDVAAWVFPSVGRNVMERGYLEPLGIDGGLAVTNWDLARRTGHVGGGDQLLGLAALIRERRVPSGAPVVLLGIGAGFTWTAAVLEL